MRTNQPSCSYCTYNNLSSESLSLFAIKEIKKILVAFSLVFFLSPFPFAAHRLNHRIGKRLPLFFLCYSFEFGAFNFDNDSVISILD